MFEWLQHVRIQTIGNAINAALLITAFVVGLSSTMVFVEARHMSDTWERFDKGAATKAIVLGDLRAALGYGGMIHQISDFVLRRDQRRLIDVQRSLRGATIALTRYQSLGTTQRERAALDTVNAAIDEHWSRVSLAERLVLDGVPTEDIYQIIGIDDTAALKAFETLEAELLAARQASGAQVYASTRRVTQLLAISSVIVGTLVAVLLIGFYLFTRFRLIRPLKALGDAMSRLAEGGHDVEIPELDRRDEIGAMARAVRIFRQNAIERRAAVVALRESEERLATILEIAPEAVMAVDADGVVELFNKGAEAMFGHSAKEIVGQPFDRLIPTRFREIYKRYLRRFGNATTTVRMMDETGDISGLRADGSVFPAQASISKIDRNGEKIFTVIIRDITEQTLARKRILDLAKFPDENPNPALRVTAAGQVLYANPAALDFGALFESADRQVLGAPLATAARQALESGSREEMEFEANGRAFTFTICPIEDGSYINLHGSEVTGRKRTQEQFNHAQKMEAVGQLTGGIAHDFNNLLMVISGYSRRALSHLGDMEVVGKSLEQILAATERAANLTKQLLVFSRRQIMEKRVFRVCDALGDIKGLLVHSVGEFYDVWIEIADKKGC
ncbi:MAG: PAS domain S-box protein, partial [Proteobacteria bacterium]|nr:PAS domain S-box protein [Pseudomonadota bacterium]